MTSKNIIFGTLVGLILLGTGFTYWYFVSGNSKPLFQQLNSGQVSEIRQFLDTQGIQYDVSPDGELLVEPSMIPSLRMEIAEKGVIQSERIGFEIFTEADYGMTEFAQKVNYQRALQGELEKSILSLEGVQHTRVHLILPKKGTLFSKQRAASASVLLHVEEGMRLEPSAIMGIQRIVSGAVEELDLEEVTVVDKFGTILSAHMDGLSASTDSQETGMKEELENLLQQWYETSDYSISLTMTRDTDRRSTRRETIAPDGKKFVVSQTNSSNKNGNAKAANDSEQRQTQYTYSKETETIEHGRSHVKHIRCAIVFGIPLSEDEINNIRRIVSAALGLDKKRGDTLEVLSLPNSSVNGKDNLNAKSSPVTLPKVSDVSNSEVVSEDRPVELPDTLNESPSEGSLVELIQKNESLKVFVVIAALLFLLLLIYVILTFVSKQKAHRQRQENIRLLVDWVNS